MRKQIDAIRIHADAFLLGTLGEELVHGFEHSQSELSGVFLCIIRVWNFHTAFKSSDNPFTASSPFFTVSLIVSPDNIQSIKSGEERTYLPSASSSVNSNLFFSCIYSSAFIKISLFVRKV